MNETTPASHESQPVLSLIAQIKEQRLDPKVIGSDDRRRCVEFLRAEGYSIAEIAQILKRDERTIFRDIKQIRADHALAPDPAFSERMIGELLHQAEISMSRLRRIAREPKASAMERLMAEAGAWKVHRECFEALQSVGYLPRMPSNVVADIYQHLAADPIDSYQETAEQARQLLEVLVRTGQADAKQEAACREIIEEAQRGALSVQVRTLKHKIEDQEVTECSNPK